MHLKRAKRVNGKVHGGRRPFFGSIGFTVLLFNILLVFLPVAGFFLLDTYEKQLLQGLERTLSEQARMIAAGMALSWERAVGLHPEGELAELARALLLSLGRQHEARIRLFDAEGLMVADSAVLERPREGSSPVSAVKLSKRAGNEVDSVPAADASASDSPLYVLASWPVRQARQLIGWLLAAPHSPPDLADLYDAGGVFASQAEIRLALQGKYGATTRIVGVGAERRLILYSALPIAINQSTPIGVVLVSQSTSRILAELYAMRLDIFRVFLWSVTVATGLSLLLGIVIARPLILLSRQAAELLDSRGRITGRFKPLRAHNEIGALSRSLEAMRTNLERYTGFLESFSTELAHEVRNPLAGIRASLDLLSSTESDPRRLELFQGALADVRRINVLLSAVGELGRIDTETNPSSLVCHVSPVMEGLVAGFRLRHPGLEIELSADPALELTLPGVDPERLHQVLDNILENAASFSPPEGKIEIAWRSLADHWQVSIRDCGPGFDPADAIRLFDRFYSSRKQGGVHAGLGLAVVKSLVLRWGGRAWAENAQPGARFVVELPRRAGRPIREG